MFRLCTKLTVHILLGLVLSNTAQAQTHALSPNTRVRISAPTYFTGSLIGTITTVNKDTLTIKHGHSAGFNGLKSGTTSFPFQALTKIEISKGRKSGNAVMGAVTGLFAGIGIVAILSKTAFSGEASLGLIFVAPITLASSTVAGTLIGFREQWQKIELSTLNLNARQ